MNKGTSGAVLADQLIPPGVVWEWASDTLPDPALYGRWAWADGSAVSRAQYPRLFKHIGVLHGAGDGTTTFNLPNRQGKTGVGVLNGDADFGTIGASGGSKTATASHVHDIAHGHGITQGGPNTNQNTSDFVNSGSYQGWQAPVTTGGAGYGSTDNENNDHAHGIRTVGSSGSGDGQGWAAFNVHNAVRTSDHGDFLLVYGGAVSGACPTGGNSGVQHHTHGHDHRHGLENHKHDLASHTHADSVTSLGAGNNSGGSSTGVANGNVQPFIAMNYIIKV